MQMFVHLSGCVETLNSEKIAKAKAYIASGIAMMTMFPKDCKLVFYDRLHECNSMKKISILCVGQI